MVKIHRKQIKDNFVFIIDELYESNMHQFYREWLIQEVTIGYIQFDEEMEDVSKIYENMSFLYNTYKEVIVVYRSINHEFLELLTNLAKYIEQKNKNN